MAKQTETEGQRHRDLQTEIERHTERKGEKGRERECMLRPFIISKTPFNSIKCFREIHTRESKIKKLKERKRERKSERVLLLLTTTMQFY